MTGTPQTANYLSDLAAIRNLFRDLLDAQERTQRQLAAALDAICCDIKAAHNMIQPLRAAQPQRTADAVLALTVRLDIVESALRTHCPDAWAQVHRDYEGQIPDDTRSL